MASSTGKHLCHQFSLAEMMLATGNFSDEHVIGKGGFGKIYKGLIDNGSSIVAVKRIASNSKQGEREFLTEIETLSKLRHCNLVSLIGYCNEQEEMILVYEYMSNGMLADHLHRNHHQMLTWNQRLRICIGVARGLDYLHTGSFVIHRDVKPANILLDEKFTAKVSGFGLAKHLISDHLESHVSASVNGSFGYFDPSYIISGRLTKASDTYAFGVVLLEVLSGRPATDGLTMWAQEKMRNGKFHEVVASTLRSKISKDCLKTYEGVVKKCLVDEPMKRLSMTQAVAQLEFALEQQESNGWASFNAFGNRDASSEASVNHDNGGRVEKQATVDICTIKVARDEDLRVQIGRDIYFDLVDHDKVPNFRIRKLMPFTLFKEEVAKEFGIPVHLQRFWIWAERKNHTYRPDRPLTSREEAEMVGELPGVSNRGNNAELKLFLEVERGPDLQLLPLPEKNKKEILLFFKVYDPLKEELRYVGRLYVRSYCKPVEILTKLNELAGFAPDVEIDLFEEIKFEPSVWCERLDESSPFKLSEIEDGDIICFQKRPCPYSEQQVRFPDVPSFLEYVKKEMKKGTTFIE